MTENHEGSVWIFLTSLKPILGQGGRKKNLTIRVTEEKLFQSCDVKKKKKNKQLALAYELAPTSGLQENESY